LIFEGILAVTSRQFPEDPANYKLFWQYHFDLRMVFITSRLGRDVAHIIAADVGCDFAVHGTNGLDEPVFAENAKC